MSQRTDLLNKIISENEGALLRMFILGNAGGTIATLSFIGTIIGFSEGHQFDSGFFCVLILFLVGLALGALTRLADWKSADVEIQHMRSDSTVRNKFSKNLPRWDKVYFLLFASTGALFVIGVVAGLVQLWRFTK